MSRARTSFLSFAAVALALIGALVVCGACGSSATTTVLLPITGITVRAESLTTELGCGPGDSQIFKYAVVVFGRDPNAFNTFDVYIASNVYDCFSDGQFVDLPPSAA